MKVRCIALALTVALAGCVTGPSMYKADPYGASPFDAQGNTDGDIQKLVKEYLTRALHKDASIGEVKFIPPDMEKLGKRKFYTSAVLDTDERYGYLVCVSFDGKDSAGAPVPGMLEGVLVRDGKVVQWFKGGWWAEVNRCDESRHISV